MPSSRPAALVLPLLLVACDMGAPGPESQRGDDAVPQVTLTGAALADELATSPARRAPVPFSRIGVRLTAQSARAIEITTSPDGSTWSRWRPISVHHSELEETALFIGDVWAMAESDRYYMLRSSGGPLPSALILDFFSAPLSDEVETGDLVVPAALAPASAAPLQYGAAQVLAREAWSPRPARCSSGHTPRRITLHHTEQPNQTKLSAQALIRSVQGYHQNTRGWCDIGYHFLVSSDGRIWQGRPVERLGAHAGAGNNTGNIGIALIGNHVATPPSEAQMAAVSALIRGLSLDYGIPLDRNHIAGHRDMRSTECPGEAAYRQLGELIARAGGDGTGTEPVPPTPLGEVRLIGAVHRDGNLADRIAEAQVTVDGEPVEVDPFGIWETWVASGTTVTVEISAPGYENGTITRTATDDPTWASLGLVEEGAVEGTAGLQGVVYTGGDGQNRIPHASIEIAGSISAGRTASATESGYWRLSGLAPGYYQVTASAPGYEPATVTHYAAPGALSWASVELQEGDFSGVEIEGPSCEDRCGSTDPVPGSTPQCHCDDNCVLYNDCCKSYFSVCR